MREIRLRGKLNGKWVVAGIAATERPTFLCIRTDVWVYQTGKDNGKAAVCCLQTAQALRLSATCSTTPN